MEENKKNFEKENVSRFDDINLNLTGFDNEEKKKKKMQVILERQKRILEEIKNKDKYK